MRHHHAKEIASVSFEGAAAARPAPGVIEAIEQAERVIICPSNPVVSIGPILAVPGIRGANPAEILRQRRRNQRPMRAAIGGQKNGSDTAHDPADFVRGSGTRQQVGKHPSRLP